MRRVQIPVLPDGRVRIHFFVRDDAGPARTPAGVLGMTPLGPITAGGLVGHFACQPKNDNVLARRGQDGIIRVLPHSDEPRAATCPECLASAAYKEAMAIYQEAQTAG